jgi:hypothetical protein
MAARVQHCKIIEILIYPLGLKRQPCELEPGGRCSFFVTFRPRLASDWSPIRRRTVTKYRKDLIAGSLPLTIDDARRELKVRDFALLV